ncbi:replication protein A 14 kDa subunit-like [Belonocnema kinseyi]|uniref:replication protein A 14 kDa subunit-like n=1 Tax=Belonocnema kinseyi TaxID=2817044 RepID=UPI00143D4385|nr:replication protein A 14 kDa subunit-like [Belonocnema kinseyi]
MLKKRIRGQDLPQNMGEVVILLGKVLSAGQDGKSVQIKTTDDVQVNVALPEPIDGNAEGYIEVSGTVKSKSTLSASSFTLFPPEMTENFSIDTYNEVLMLQNLLGDKKWRFSEDSVQLF